MFVKDFEDYKITKSGEVISQKTGKEIKSRRNEFGYYTVFIRNSAGEYKTMKVHRLVAMAYLSNPEGLPEVNHIDGDKGNNNHHNLEWVSSKRNKEHAWENGLYSHKCENHYGTDLTENDVRKVCELLVDGYRNSDVSSMTGVSRHTVTNIKNKRVWKDITTQYAFKVKRQDRKDPKAVEKVCSLLEQGYSVSEIVAYLSGKIKDYDVRRIKNRKIFKSISDKYNF